MATLKEKQDSLAAVEEKVSFGILVIYFDGLNSKCGYPQKSYEAFANNGETTSKCKGTPLQRITPLISHNDKPLCFPMQILLRKILFNIIKQEGSINARSTTALLPFLTAIILCYQIAELQAAYDNSIAEKETLTKNIAQTAARLKRASKLTTALGDEQGRWTENVAVS